MPAADLSYPHAIFNELDGFAGLRNGLRLVAEKEQSWAGIPMPLDGRRLVIEPKFPRAAALAEIGISQKQRTEEEAEAARLHAKWGESKVRNRFWSFHRKSMVVVFEDRDGKVRHVLDHNINPATRLIDTLDCSHAWGIEQEARAVQTLGTLLRHHTFKAYLLTGMFLERSQRSGLVYVFRKLRPTIVLDTGHKDGQVRIRTTLCMHPIGYYEDTWAGAMCPTDDVIAHLMMMRGDEPLLWRRANQHPPWRPEAGLAL